MAYMIKQFFHSGICYARMIYVNKDVYKIVPNNSNISVVEEGTAVIGIDFDKGSTFTIGTLLEETGLIIDRIFKDSSEFFDQYYIKVHERSCS